MDFNSGPRSPYTAGKVSPAVVTTDSYGDFSATITPATVNQETLENVDVFTHDKYIVAGYLTLDVQPEPAQMTLQVGGQSSVTLAAGRVSPGNRLDYGGELSLADGTPISGATWSVNLYDSSHNPVSFTQGVWPSGITEFPDYTTNSDGSYGFFITGLPAAPGTHTYTLETSATVNGTLVKKADATITIHNQPVMTLGFGGQSSVSVVAGGVGNGDPLSYGGKLTLEDGTPFSGAAWSVNLYDSSNKPVSFTQGVTLGGTIIVCKYQTGPDGSYGYTISGLPETPGTYTLEASATVDGVPVKADAAITVTVGPPYQVTLHTNQQKYAVGSTITLGGQVSDRYGNAEPPNTAVTVSFGSGVVMSYFTITDQSGGFAYDVPAPQHPVKGFPISASAGSASNQLTVDVVAGPPDHVTLNPASYPVDAATGTTSVTGAVYDRFGNPTQGTVTLSIPAYGTFGAIAYNSDGSFSAPFSLAGAKPPTMPYTEQFTAGLPSSSTGSAQGSIGIAFQPDSLTLVFDNTTGVTAGAGDVLSGFVSDHGYGVYNCDVSLTSNAWTGVKTATTGHDNGDYSLNVTAPQKLPTTPLVWTVTAKTGTLVSQPASITVNPGQPAGITGPAGSVAIDGQTSVSGRVYDQYGNGVGAATVDLSAPAGDGSITSPVTTDGAGGFTTAYTAPSTAGVVTINASVPGTPAAGIISETVTPGPVDSGRSSVTASPSSVPADGVTTSTITATLMDAGGNPLPNKAVSLTANGGSSTITPSCAVTGGDGTVSFAVYDTSAQTVTYSADDATDGATAGAVQVIFKPTMVVTGLVPSSGPAAGGTLVTVEGTGLGTATAVYFGSVAGTVYGTPTAGTLSVYAPAGPSGGGSVNVVVYGPGGPSSPTAADLFTYYSGGPLPALALAITTTSLASGTVGQPYSETITTNGEGTAPYAFAVNSGSLPPGLALDASTGVISGTPATAGSYAFTVTVKDATNASVSASYTLTVGVAPTTPNTTLNDIGGSWAQGPIKKLLAMGYVTGYPDDTFRPDNDITRAEFATLLVKALNTRLRGYPPPTAGHVFADTEGSWAQSYISTAAAYGIVKGYDAAHFGPEDLVTREQMTAMVVRAAKLARLSGELTFTDAAQIDAWARADVITAVKDGIIHGYPDNTFRPLNHATRAEAVTVIMGILK